MAHHPKIFDFTSGSIDLNEISFGTGTGITSSSFFKWDESRVNLLASTSSNFGKGNCTYRSSIIGGKCNCIDYGNDSSIIGGCQNQILSATNSNIIIGGKCSTIKNAGFSTIIGGWSSSVIGTSSFMAILNSPFSVIKASQIQSSSGASIFGGSTHLIGESSENSFILGGNANCIESSANSVIIGGEFLCIQGDDKLVYIPELKLDTVDNFQEGSCVLIWDNDKKVRRRSISSLAASMSVAAVSINSSEVSFGNSTSTGITSSNNFTYVRDLNNLLSASQSDIFNNQSNQKPFNSSIISGLSQSIRGTVSNSSIIGGFRNCIQGGYAKSSTAKNSACSSSIIGSWNSKVYNSDVSSVISSTGSVVDSSSYFSTIISSDAAVTESKISISCASSMIGSLASQMYCVRNSILLGSNKSAVNRSQGVSIISSSSSSICSAVAMSSIIGGLCNCICGGSLVPVFNSIILGGCCNTITCNTSNGSIISSVGSTMSSAIGGLNGSIIASRCSIICSSLNYGSIIDSSISSVITGNHCNANISASRNSFICGRSGSSISMLSTQFSCIYSQEICGICNSSIIASKCSVIRNMDTASSDPSQKTCMSFIIGSGFNAICGGGYSALIGSCLISMTGSCRSSVISSAGSTASSATSSSIIASELSRIQFSSESAIMATCLSSITFSCNSVILGGECGRIVNSFDSGIIAGSTSLVQSSCGALILGGMNNFICSSTASTIIGGTGLTLSNVSNIVYVPKLKIATASISNSAPRVLVWDCATCDVFWRCDTSIGGSPLITVSQIAFGCDNSIGITSSSALSFSQSTFNTKIGDNVSTFGSGTCRSVFLSGAKVGSKGDNVITGSNNIIVGANYYSKVDNSQYSTILSGTKNCLNKGYLSSIISSNAINSCGLCASSHIASYVGTICDSCRTSVISTANFCIGSSRFSSIIGGSNNTILSSTNSVIIGGKGLTLSNVNDQVITPSLCVSGSLSLQVITASNNITLGSNNFTLLAWAPSSGAGMTVSLPSASVARHRMYVIKKMDASTQSFVFIKPNSGDNIEGTTTYITLESPYDYNMLQSDGVNTWIKLGGAVGINL